ncbi:MAG: hypothetical protein A3F11_02615 [Gammaproteobacteria bacterium RIFCSPHIGHO2_12_FULL_37_14]|nr:MAG: hypothetical protein A3F11_02615 [Gammaproteobacteria bacterium RIFCSPHIGHO2_12_FULL_37_14]
MFALSRDKFFSAAISNYQTKAFKQAHMNFNTLRTLINSSSSLPNDLTKEKLLQCDLGILACQLSDQAIYLKYAREKFEQLKQQYLAIKEKTIVKQSDIDRCQEILIRLESPRQEADYHCYFVKRVDDFFLNHHKELAKNVSLIDALHAAESAIDFYTQNETEHNVKIPPLHRVLTRLYPILAEQYVNKGNNQEESLEKRINYVEQAAEFYIKLLKLLGERIISNSEYISKIIPLHFEIVKIWHQLAVILIAEKHEKSYNFLNKIRQYITHNQLYSLVKEYYINDYETKNELIQQLDNHLLLVMFIDDDFQFSSSVADTDQSIKQSANNIITEPPKAEEPLAVTLDQEKSTDDNHLRNFLQFCQYMDKHPMELCNPEQVEENIKPTTMRP